MCRYYWVAPETIALCRTLETEGLASERVFDEWKKLILKGRKPSRGLEFLQECGWIRYYPELQALGGCQQDPEWHSESDMWTHTLHAMDAFALERLNDEWEDLVVGLACLCHALGKPTSSTLQDGRIRPQSHEEAGEHPTRMFLGRMTNQPDLIGEIVPLVCEHLKPTELYESGTGAPGIRRLALRVSRIDRLVRVARAVWQGRPSIPFQRFPEGEWLLQHAQLLGVSNNKSKPIMVGRHLIDLGISPGRHFGEILAACFEAQLDGRFTTVEEGIELIRTIVDARVASSAPNDESGPEVDRHAEFG